jgi:hypothetical protein
MASANGKHTHPPRSEPAGALLPGTAVMRPTEELGRRRRADGANGMAEQQTSSLRSEALGARLARAHIVLRRILESLRGSSGVKDLLGHALPAIAEQTGVQSATAWLVDPGGYQHLIWVLENGRRVRGEHAAHPNATKPNPPGAFGREWARDLHRGQRIQIVSKVSNHPLLDAEHRQYLQRIGANALISMPIVVGGESFGVVSLRLESEHHPIAHDCELIDAFADQAALAFRLTRAADARRAAALARERQLAAERRAAKVAQANRALQDTLESLRTADDLQMFVGRCLRLMGGLSRSHLGYAFLMGGEQSLRLAWMLEHDRLIAGAEAPGPYANRPIPAGAYRSWWADLGFDPDVPDAVTVRRFGWSVVRQFGAVGGGVWRAEARGTASMIATVEDGEVRAVGAAEHPAKRMGERPIPNAAIPRRGEICVDDEATIATRSDYAPFREYFARRASVP